MSNTHALLVSIRAISSPLVLPRPLNVTSASTRLSSISRFPLFFVFIFLSSSNLPRNLLKTGWFHTVATWNPISYLIEAFRSLYIIGWDSTALLRGFAVAIGLTVIALLLVAGALRVRLQRT